MKKYLLIAITSLSILFCMNTAVFAADAPVGAFDVCDRLNTSGSVCSPSTRAGDDPITGSGGILTKAINLVTFLTGVSSIIIIIIGGIKYVTSAGDPGKVSSAKDTILYAVIGLLISVSARGIILFVVNRVR